MDQTTAPTGQTGAGTERPCAWGDSHNRYVRARWSLTFPEGRWNPIDSCEIHAMAGLRMAQHEGYSVLMTPLMEVDRG